MEIRLGLPLFHRGTNRFALTNFGAECYEYCARMAGEADRLFAHAEHARGLPTGSLHVVCPPVLGSLVIEWLAAKFASSVPGVRLHLEEATGILDPRSIQADLLIYATSDPLPDSTLVAKRLFSAPTLLICRPDLLEGREPIVNPDQLRSIRCLGLGPRGSDWSWTFDRGSDVATVRFEPWFTTNLPSALLKAVQQGLGAAVLSTAICAEGLTDGRLIALLDGWTPRPMDVYAIYPSSRTLPVAARGFLDLLIRDIPSMARGIAVSEGK
jgi:DNA-binding transcriptional LysR family regulator